MSKFGVSHNMIHGHVRKLDNVVFLGEAKELDPIVQVNTFVGIGSFNNTLVEPTDEECECNRVIFRQVSHLSCPFLKRTIEHPIEELNFLAEELLVNAERPCRPARTDLNLNDTVTQETAEYQYSY